MKKIDKTLLQESEAENFKQIVLNSFDHYYTSHGINDLDFILKYAAVLVKWNILQELGNKPFNETIFLEQFNYYMNNILPDRVIEVLQKRSWNNLKLPSTY